MGATPGAFSDIIANIVPADLHDAAFGAYNFVTDAAMLAAQRYLGSALDRSRADCDPYHRFAIRRLGGWRRAATLEPLVLIGRPGAQAPLEQLPSLMPARILTGLQHR